MKAVFLDLNTLDDLDLTALQGQCTELVIYNSTSSDQVLERIKDAELIITNKVVLDQKAIQSVPSLKLICVVATGTNNIDLDAAAAAGVVVCNCVAYGVNSVVQHVWSLVLALHTQLLRYDNAAKQGDWASADQFCILPYPIRELSGRTLGILGFGNLGQGVAKVASAFGMSVIVGELPGKAVREGRVSFEELVSQSDVLSLHCPLSDQTKDLINANVLSAMKSDAMLINCARGGIVNEEDLAAALKAGDIAGAATDVLTQEPPRNGNVLLDSSLTNLLITPHSAWGSIEARERIIEQTVENIQAFKADQPVRTV